MNAATARHHAKMLMPRRCPRKNISINIFDAVMTTPRCPPSDAEAVVPNGKAQLPGRLKRLQLSDNRHARPVSRSVLFGLINLEYPLYPSDSDPFVIRFSQLQTDISTTRTSTKVSSMDCLAWRRPPEASHRRSYLS